MDFTIGKPTLKYLTDTIAHLGEAVASPTKKTINAWDFGRIRLLSYSPAGAVAGKGRDIGLETDSLAKISKRAADGIRLTITPEALTMKFGNTTYRMRTMEPTNGPGIPATDSSGEITMQCKELRGALADVQATGSTSVVIAITKNDGVELRAEGDGAAGGWIPVTNAQYTGTGYSKLHLEILLKCVPDINGLAARISLSPKNPTKILFGDDITYYQAAAI